MKKILVPCDFSRSAVNAVQSAVTFADAEFTDAEKIEIHLLHVIELPVIHDSVLMPVMQFEDSLLTELKQKAENTFKKMLAGFSQASMHVETIVLFGPVSRVILTYIREHQIDLVIMGTRGDSGIHEIFIGSNTEKIVRASQAPVLVIRNPVDIRNIKQIVFPTHVDFEPMETLMRNIKFLQNFLKAKLHLVWINTPGNFSNDEKTLARLNDLAIRHMLTDYTINIFNDTMEESGIIRFSHHVKADLLVMATHGRRGLAHIFSGSLTEDVVNHIDLPVWTFSIQQKDIKVLS
jgi:nucleotide-binding universal stress UspA family protein